MQKAETEWFATWFGSPYYDLLYAHRNETEAESFIKLVCQCLNVEKGSKALDLACGWGRHSLTLCNLGLEVTGLDLSTEFIERARKLVKGKAVFKVQDMRVSFGENEFDVALNLFTSFGYFQHSQENERVLENVFQSLKPGGFFVLDFLNREKTVANLVAQEVKQVGDIQFNIQRKVMDGRIIKEIELRDAGKTLQFSESVQAFSKEELEKMILASGFTIQEIWGDYQGGSWVSENSNRVIFITQKPKLQV